MRKPSIKDRIAYFNLAGAATLVLVIFVVIYRIVLAGVVYGINHDLKVEVDRHTAFVAGQGHFEKMVKDNEWAEAERNTMDGNPIFVEIFDKNGNAIKKSNNLKTSDLIFHRHKDTAHYNDVTIGNITVRQMQAQLVNQGELEGYVVIGMSISDHYSVMKSLRIVLFIAYPLVLLMLFFLTRFIAGKSLQPVFSIISATKEVSDKNLNTRISLPEKKDELYTLAIAINELLDRIESAVSREKQFTSHASHELRTPLAVIKGTLEVLVRKPRTTEEYEAKIQYCINEVNRLTTIADQLLILTRFESSKEVVNKRQLALDEIILEAIERHSPEMEKRNMHLDFTFGEHYLIMSDVFMAGVIMDNLIGNAIKYSNDGGTVSVLLSDEKGYISCLITDKGIGIAKEDLENIFEQFYRSEAEEHNEIKGTGLGLAIVRRYCDILGISLNISSTKGEGTQVLLRFPVA
ncbi:sensor histidine kinase [Flavobacterium sp. RHBU_3]|uniref:sensor histidine kinase n=1 Tax=Flavobacterium sp. RHBU_3 TaxID=3391184 RepID=UPI003985287D